MMEFKIERRKFVNAAGKGLAAFLILKTIPFRSLFTGKNKGKGIKVEIHPQAVKRNRKGLNG